MREPSTFPQLDESARKITPFGHKRSDVGLFQRPAKRTFVPGAVDGRSALFVRGCADRLCAIVQPGYPAHRKHFLMRCDRAYQYGTINPKDLQIFIGGV